jgi:hypothetical protein
MWMHSDWYYANPEIMQFQVVLLDTSIFRNFDVSQNDRESVNPTESGWIVSLVTSNVIELVGNVTVSCFDNSPPH